MAATTDTRPGNALLAGLAPNATVFVSSACIMVIELVAGRLASRYLGQSLYTWTTIIGVVLAGISLGNYLGGRLADRASGRGTLAIQFFVAAAGCLSILAVNDTIGPWEPLGGLNRAARIVLHLTLTFLLPAVLLGTISPVIAKRALRLGHATGVTMGNVYAWAIAGSIVGTFATGFYLLDRLSYSCVVLAVCAAMALLGAVYAAGALRARGQGMQDEITHDAVRPVGRAERWPLHEWFVPVATVFLANGCVMVMEIVAGRMIARQYGQSLYTWTSVIGVVLAGMSIGSYLGGRLADRFRADKTLTALFVLSSVTCLAANVIDDAFRQWQVLFSRPWPVQIAIHSTLAFLVPSILMGAVSPVVAKTALSQGRPAGRTVGSIYAWGAVGSIVGTFGAGFVLIAALGMKVSLGMTAGVLSVMGLLYGRRTLYAYVIAVICALALVGAVVPVPGPRHVALLASLCQFPSPDAVYIDESQYSYIGMLADSENPNVRQLVLDKLVHSKVDIDNPRDLGYEYEWVYAAILDGHCPPGGPITAMVIGGGGYTFPHYLELARPGSYVEASEIDPAVTEAAHAAFGFPRDSQVHVFNMDARNRVDALVRQKRAGEEVPAFDCIFGDSINDYSVPYHLTTREFNEDLKGLLRPGGLYMLNMIDAPDSGRFLGAVVNTLRQTFDHVAVFSCALQSEERDTFVVVSSMRPLDLEGVVEDLRRQHPYYGDLIEASFLDDLIERTGACVLTDDFAPVENMLAPVVRRSRDTRLVEIIRTADAGLGAGDLDEVITVCKRGLRTWPRAPELHEFLGVALTKKGDLPRAISQLQQLTELAPDRESGHVHLAQALMAATDFDAAAASWQRAIELEPAHVAAHVNLGATFIKKGNPAAAVAPLRKALELDPQSVSAHNNLAAALFGAGDLERAVRELQTVLAIEPGHAGVYPQLAVAYWKLGDYHEAWKAVEKAGGRGEAVASDFLEALKRDSGRTR